MPEKTPRQQLLERHSALKAARSSWDAHWGELSDYIEPRRSRFFTVGNVSRGTKRNQNIINDTATWSARVLAAGMMSGVTSPARPWFRLITPDQDLAEVGPVREWLGVVERRILLAFERSNVYRALQEVYLALGTFGTAVLHLDEDARTLVRAYTLPVGEYCLALDARQEVDTCYRETSMTVKQLVQRFGRDACSARVRDAYDNGRLDEWVQVLHALAPNDAVDGQRADARGMAWTSRWLETTAEDGRGLLGEAGYREMPVMAARWAINGEDVYGHSPGMQSLGDIKALQVLEKRKAEAVDKLVRPPLQGPTSLLGRGVSLVPGDVTYLDAVNPSQVLRPLVEVRSDAVLAIREAIAEHEGRIKRAYYADLWLAMLEAGQPPNMTAREVAERHDEKMLQLGPVMEGLEDDLLDPLVNRTFGMLLRRGYLPPPPQELQGQELRVQYISIMAQAQRMLGITAIDRLTTFAVGTAVQAQRLELLDKLDLDQAVDEYAAALGTPPRLVRTEDAVQALRDARAKQQQQAAAMQQAAAAAQGAKTLSQADTGGDNALTRLMGPMAAAESGMGQ